MCCALGIHVFDYSHKASEDQTSTTWEKIVNHVRTIHGNYISNKLLNKKTVIIPKTDHTQDALDEHLLVTKIRDQSYQHL